MVKLKKNISVFCNYRDLLTTVSLRAGIDPSRYTLTYAFGKRRIFKKKEHAKDSGMTVWEALKDQVGRKTVYCYLVFTVHIRT